MNCATIVIDDNSCSPAQLIELIEDLGFEATILEIIDLIKADEAQNIRIYDAEDKTLWPPSLHLKIAQKQKRVKKQLIM